MKLPVKSRRLIFFLVVCQLGVCTIWIQRYRQKTYPSLDKANSNSPAFNDPRAPLVDITDLNIPVMNVWLPNLNDTECAEAFMLKYRDYCEKMSLARTNSSVNGTEENLCPCVPSTLIGRSNVSLENTTLADLEMKHTELHLGGRWFPTSCTARQKIAIIVPFHDRQSHLTVLMNNLHSTLQRQQVDYTIFVVEQAEPFQIFNKGVLMNAAFIEARRRGSFDCYLFHDVDMILEDDRNMYTCSRSPRHLGAFILKYNYDMGYGGTIGGVSAYTRKQFERVNGFSTECYGWGGEDDDMAFRISHKRLGFIRFPRCVSRYTMISHSGDVKNPEGPCRLEYHARRNRSFVYDFVGLNSVKYKLLDHRLYQLFTWLYVEVPPMPVKITVAPSRPSSTTTTFRGNGTTPPLQETTTTTIKPLSRRRATL